MIIKDEYLRLIDDLTPKYKKIFGMSWWYSLISEKNPSKSMVFHNLVKGKLPLKNYRSMRAIFLGFKKYFSFIVRYFIFGSNRGEISKLSPKILFVTYNKEFMYPFTEADGLHVYMPQKNRWKEYKGKLVIDNFISLSDLFRLFINYVFTVFENIFYFKIYKLKKDIVDNFFPYSVFKEDVWRSFAGDVLVEGLFYEMAFENMRNRFTNLEKIIYPYEGLAWEKALNVKYNRIKNIIGILCSIPSDNTLNFFPTKDEIEQGLPHLRRLGVFGKILRDKFSTLFDGIFIIGPMRFRNIKDLLENKKVEKIIYDILVIMPSNKQMALELMNWVWEVVFYNKYKKGRICVKPHPDNSRDLFKFVGNITVSYNLPVDDLLGKSKTVISIDSSVEFMALAMGKEVISPTLPSFVNLSPLDVGIRAGTADHSINKYINNYFDFSKDEKEQLNKI